MGVWDEYMPTYALREDKKKVKIKCPNCGGTGTVAVGECCGVCCGVGTIEAEKAD